MLHDWHALKTFHQQLSSSRWLTSVLDGWQMSSRETLLRRARKHTHFPQKFYARTWKLAKLQLPHFFFSPSFYFCPQSWRSLLSCAVTSEEEVCTQRKRSIMSRKPRQVCTVGLYYPTTQSLYWPLSWPKKLNVSSQFYLYIYPNFK